jgi:predicted nucleic acid-binding protein
LRIYLDTSVLIRCVEGGLDERAASLRWLDRAAASPGGTVVSSAFAQAECLIKPIRLKDDALMRAYEDFFRNSGVVFEPVTQHVLNRAAHIRADYGLKMGDAIHIATALETGCTFAVMRDEPMRKKTPIFGLPLLGLND